MRGARVQRVEATPTFNLETEVRELHRIGRSMAGCAKRAQATVAAHLGRHILTQRRHGDVPPPLGQEHREIAVRVRVDESRRNSPTGRVERGAGLLHHQRAGRGDDDDDPGRDRDIGPRTGPGVSR